MKSKAGILCMILGAALVFGALFLFIHNQNESRQAQAASEALIGTLVAEMETGEASQAPQDNGADFLDGLEIPEAYQDPASFTMAEVVIDGYSYIGCLSIPDLELELPILSEWDYQRLKIAPCRYFGTVRGDNLVLLAHNYTSHFGKIRRLEAGMRLYFTDAEGITTEYQVMGQDVLAPTAVEEVISGEYDLTLFTCTYGGESRVTVYCDRVEN